MNRLAGIFFAVSTFVGHALSAEYYVNAAQLNDDGDGLSWETAKQVLQSGVDLAASGDTVWVKNGTYASVLSLNAVRIISVKGAQSTTIDAHWAGRAVDLEDGAFLSGFTVKNGSIAGPGGGVRCAGSNAVISNCVIQANRGLHGGGLFGGQAVDCVVRGNVAEGGDGGGVYSTLCRNVVFFDNQASGRGGGAYGASLINCTLSENQAGGSGGGVFGGTLVNSISYFNAGSDVSGAVATFSCAADVPHHVNGCISGDPLFVDRINRSFRLQQTSPCRNSGDNSAVTGLTDLDALPRILNGTVDMGAYESSYQFVSALTGSDEQEGTSWTTAKQTLQAAVDATVGGYSVWVSNGVYNSGGKVTSANSLTNRVCVLQKIAIRSVNGPEVTVIEGARNPSGDGFGPAAVRCALLYNGASLSGFTLTNGSTFAKSYEGQWTANLLGGGVLLYMNCVVSNCVIVNCQVDGFGGGAMLNDGGEVVDCDLLGNYSTYCGGGAYLNSGGTVRRNRFIGNEAFHHGGGVELQDDSFAGESFFSENLCSSNGGYGGGIYCGNSTISNCVVTSNSGGIGGGIAVMSRGSVMQCAVTKNYATQSAGGVYVRSSGDPVSIRDHRPARRAGGTWPEHRVRWTAMATRPIGWIWVAMNLFMQRLIRITIRYPIRLRFSMG